MAALLMALLLIQPELIERTLALVGGQAITLNDVRAIIALGLADGEPAPQPIAAVTSQLVDRALVLREVQRYAPAAPADSAIEARMEEIRKRAGGAAPLADLLERHGFTEVRLLAWIRDDLRTQAYLSQRFASASTPTDAEISAEFARSRGEFDRAGTTFEQAVPILRDRLVAARRRELIADWIADLRRRTDVVILQQ
jgi:hypothetical protein